MIRTFPPERKTGPTAQNVLTEYSTAEGGATESLIRYGFASGNYNPVGLQLTMGGNAISAPTFQVFDYGDNSQVLPLQSLHFSIPSGAPGSSVDLTVSTPDGTATVKNAVTYLPATQQYSLPGSQLLQGVYDPKRDVYYFTDQSQIRIFSRSQSKWFPSSQVTPPAGAQSQRLFGVAFSPNASQLAVSDSGAHAIYLINPDAPRSVQIFPIPTAGSVNGTSYGGSPGGPRYRMRESFTLRNGAAAQESDRCSSLIRALETYMALQ